MKEAMKGNPRGANMLFCVFVVRTFEPSRAHVHTHSTIAKVLIPPVSLALTVCRVPCAVCRVPYHRGSDGRKYRGPCR